MLVDGLEVVQLDALPHLHQLDFPETLQTVIILSEREIKQQKISISLYLEREFIFVVLTFFQIYVSKNPMLKSVIVRSTPKTKEIKVKSKLETHAN